MDIALVAIGDAMGQSLAHGPVNDEEQRDREQRHRQ